MVSVDETAEGVALETIFPISLNNLMLNGICCGQLQNVTRGSLVEIIAECVKAIHSIDRQVRKVIQVQKGREWYS